MSLLAALDALGTRADQFHVMLSAAIAVYRDSDSHWRKSSDAHSQRSDSSVDRSARRLQLDDPEDTTVPAREGHVSQNGCVTAVEAAPQAIAAALRWMSNHRVPASANATEHHGSSPAPQCSRLLACQRLVPQLLHLWLLAHSSAAAGRIVAAGSSQECGYTSWLALFNDLVSMIEFPGPCVPATQVAIALLGATVDCEASGVGAAGIEQEGPSPRAAAPARSDDTTTILTLLQQEIAHAAFAEGPLPLLFEKLASTNAVVAAEAWSLFNALMLGPSASCGACAILAAHTGHVVAQCVRILTPVGRLPQQATSYVATRQLLKALATFVGAAQFSKIRPRLLDSPALLWAVMQCTNDPSHNIRFEAYHVLKVFIARPTKILPIRRIFVDNRELFCSYLLTMTTGDAATDQQIATERPVLLKRVLAVAPLTHEEEVLLEGARRGRVDGESTG